MDSLNKDKQQSAQFPLHGSLYLLQTAVADWLHLYSYDVSLSFSRLVLCLVKDRACLQLLDLVKEASKGVDFSCDQAIASFYELLEFVCMNFVQILSQWLVLRLLFEDSF